MDPLKQSPVIAHHQPVATESVANREAVTEPAPPPHPQGDEAHMRQKAKKTNSIFRFISKFFNKAGAELKKLDGERFSHIVSGKSKRVHTDKHSPHTVVYSAVKSIFERILGSNKAEMREEVKTAQEIKAILKIWGVSGESHLATELIEEKGTDELQGEYVVRTPKADTDLDKLLRKKALKLTDRFELCEQILKGLHHLHQAGFVHGDLKADNIFHYEEPQPNGNTNSILRIGDFGKARRVKEDESILRTGNPRLAPPEGGTSKKGEVFAAALLLIEVLEGGVLKSGKEMVIDPSKVKSDQKGKNLRGVIRFVVTNDACTQTDAKNIQGKIRLLAGSVKKMLNVRNEEREKTTSEEVGKYIRALFSELKKDKSISEQSSLDFMQKMLLDMVDANPSARPKMSDAVAQFGLALQAYKSRAFV